MSNPEFILLFRLALVGGAPWGLWRSLPHMVASVLWMRRKLRVRGLARLKRKRAYSWAAEGHWHFMEQFRGYAKDLGIVLPSHGRIHPRPRPYGGRPRRWFKERERAETKPEVTIRGLGQIWQYPNPAKYKRDVN